ncbi:MAG: TIGR03936 family radical SAM-associated protein [Bacillota bacterium]
MSERIRCQLVVSPRVRWVSHLEFLRTVTRAVRRARLPVRHSEGYNPHLLLSFAAARPVGLSSEAEFVDLMTDGSACSDEVRDGMNAAFPAGFSVRNARAVRPQGPSLTSAINASRYSYHPEEKGLWREALREFCSLREVPVLRKRHGKADRLVDIRPHVYDVSLACDCGEVEIVADMALGGQNNVRPQEFFSAVASLAGVQGENLPVRMHRLDMYRREDGNRIEPWDL